MLNLKTDNVLCDKTLNIAKSPKTDEYQRGLTSMIYKSFDNNFAANTSWGGNKCEIMSDQQLVEELHKSIMKTFWKHKIYDFNIWFHYRTKCDKLDDVVDEYSNTYHGIINMKCFNVKLGNFGIENQKNFRIEKVIKKIINYMWSAKVTIIPFNNCINKKNLL